jgi:lysophospholipase L1-like esterase
LRQLNREQIEYLVQFIHPEKRFMGFPGTLDEEAVAKLLGTDLTTYQQIKASFAANALRAAHELLTEPGLAASIDRLPFAPGDKIVGLGDSLTDDSQSWFEMLRHVLALRRPNDRFILLNAGISAQTSSEIFARFLDVVREQPAWILCPMGANDTWYWTHAPLKLNVSLEETEKNLLAMRQAAATLTQARWVWFTPPPFIPELVMAHWYQGTFDMFTRNEDVQAIARFIARQPDPVVDLQAVFGQPANPALLMDDGLHPNLEGHKAILRALLQRINR